MQQWSFNFGPGFITPEQMEEMQRQQQEQKRQAIERKQCVMCENAYLINDQVAICNKSGECVDGKCGIDCENWKPLEI